MRLRGNRYVPVLSDGEPDDRVYQYIWILLVLYLWDGILSMLPVSAVSGLVGILIILSIAAFYIWHMTGNALISGAVEIIGAAAAVIVFVAKRELYENLLTNLLGRLALADVFTGITENSIVDVTGIVYICQL